METITTPELYCPLPTAINEHVEPAEQYALEWAQQTGLIGDDDAWGVAAARIGYLASFALPEVSWEALRIGVAYLDWLMVYDDARVDKLVHVSKLTGGGITGFHQRVLDILGGHDSGTPDADGVEAALYRGIRDLRRSIVRTCPGWRLDAFIRGFAHYLQSNLWEARNTWRAEPPLPPAYMAMRRHTGCLFPTYRLSAALAGIELPAEVRDHVVVQQLEVMANNYTCWINDVYSVRRELADGHVNSLVMSLRHAHGASLQEALDRAAELCRMEVEAYLQLKSQLSSLGLGELPQLERYLRVVESWMRALYDWHQLTGRYDLTLSREELAPVASEVVARAPSRRAGMQ